MRFVFIDRVNGKDKNSGLRGKPVRSWKRAMKLAKKRFPKKQYPVIVMIGTRIVTALLVVVGMSGCSSCIMQNPNW